MTGEKFTGVLTLPVIKRHALEGEMARRVHDLLMEYQGQVSLVSTLGVLECVKLQIYQQTEA